MEKPDGPSADSYTDLYNLYNEMIRMKNGRVVYPVDLTGCLKDLATVTEKLRISKADAIREAIKHYAEELRGLEVVTYRKVTEGQAREEIRRYLKGKGSVRADEISDALRMDFDLVNKVLLEMWGEGWVEPER